jgi:hypothetical protein
MTKRAPSDHVVTPDPVRDALAARIKSRQMVLALSIAESNSLRQAAERLHMTQPGATRMLQDLERILKVSLFERTPRGKMIWLYYKAELADGFALVLLDPWLRCFYRAA